MNARMTLNTTRFDRAMAAFRKNSKRSVRALMEEQARGFIRRVVAITPPASGHANSDARKAGEATINADTALTLEVMSDRAIADQQNFAGGNAYAANQLRNKKGEVYLQDTNYIILDVAAALLFHLSKRSKSTGRPPRASKGKNMRMRDAGAHNQHVGRWKSDDIAIVPKRVLDGVRRELYKRVGLLDAGWNAAAEKLGVRVPAWVKRHGNSHGSIEVIVTATGVRIVMRNAVKFGPNVRGYQYRIQNALNMQAAAMEKKTKFYVEHTAKKAGFKVR